MVFEISQIFGWLATILFSLMLIPQITKTIRTKSTKGVSIYLFVIYLVANIIALTYALLIDQNPLKIKYTLAIFTSLFYIGVFMHYRKSNNVNRTRNLKV